MSIHTLGAERPGDKEDDRRLMELSPKPLAVCLSPMGATKEDRDPKRHLSVEIIEPLVPARDPRFVLVRARRRRARLLPIRRSDGSV